VKKAIAIELPLFPLGTVLFPGMVLPLHIFEQRYRNLVGKRLNEDPMFGVVLTRLGREVGDEPEIHTVGTAASLIDVARYSDGRYDLAIRGGRRFKVMSGHWDYGFMTGTIEWIAANGVIGDERNDLDSLHAQVSRAFTSYLEVLQRIADVRAEQVDLPDDAVAAAYIICAIMPFDSIQRQRLLEIESPTDLLQRLLEVLRRERRLLEVTGIGGAASPHMGSPFSTN